MDDRDRLPHLYSPGRSSFDAVFAAAGSGRHAHLGGRVTNPPAGFHTVTARMVVSDAEEAVRFLRAVFDAVGEVHPDRPAEVHIGDSLVMVTSAGERDLFPAFLYIYVDDADRVYHRAIAAGATSIEPPLDTPYGDRRAMVRDPLGNVFQIAHRSAERS